MTRALFCSTVSSKQFKCLEGFGWPLDCTCEHVPHSPKQEVTAQCCPAQPTSGAQSLRESGCRSHTRFPHPTLLSVAATVWMVVRPPGEAMSTTQPHQCQTVPTFCLSLGKKSTSVHCSLPQRGASCLNDSWPSFLLSGRAFTSSSDTFQQGLWAPLSSITMGQPRLHHPHMESLGLRLASNTLNF